MKTILKKDKIGWQDCKKYKQFDNPRQTYENIKSDVKHCKENTKKCEDLRKKVSDPTKVAEHSFYPLIAFEIKERRVSKIKAMQEEKRFLEEKIKSEDDAKKLEEYNDRLKKLDKEFSEKVTKIRPIKYASHMDGHIYGYYAREILLPKYEDAVQKNGLEEEILAYRTIPEDFVDDEDFHRRNNINMAKEVFQQIINRDCNCIALAYDLKSFYDTIDHKKLKEAWCKLLGEEELPPDHYNIYKSLTKFCYMELKTICRYFNYEKYCCSKDGKHCGNCALCKKPKTDKLPTVLFKEPKKFREFRKWCTKEDFKQNPGLKDDTENPYGIPQGSALSSVLSNIYLLDFDINVRSFTKERKAVYRRYCDDIMIVCDKKDRKDINDYVRAKILAYGNHLKIHDIEEGFKYSKSQVYDFTDKEKIKKQPLQYLGFCFDGANVTIRGSSLNRFYRKAKRGAIASRLTVLRKLYELKEKGKQLKEKQKKLYRRRLYELYTHIGKNNFYSYVRRAFDGMDGVDNSKIKHQISRHIEKVERDIKEQDKYIEVAWNILEKSNTLLDYQDYDRLVYTIMKYYNKPSHKDAKRRYFAIHKMMKKLNINFETIDEIFKEK